jgi:hypothetical protein
LDNRHQNTDLNLRRIAGGMIFNNRYRYSGARLTIVPAWAGLCGTATRPARAISGNALRKLGTDDTGSGGSAGPGIARESWRLGRFPIAVITIQARG